MKSPVIVLPDDEVRKQQLHNKLAEYKGRMDSFLAPELQMDTICKITVLERLLHDGKVTTWGLSREMGKTYGSGFSPEAFVNACGVIDDYCKTGGTTVSGGTGLPIS